MTLDKTWKISLVLFLSFLVFYTIQIPFYTNKPDVLVFALRSMVKSPILDIAYLKSTTFMCGNPLPNYHLGHTLILWAAYHIMPLESLSSTIWLSGFVSAISGALIVVLTFLIWKKLNLNIKQSLSIALIVGLIPSFWEESIIGEVYALQFLFILLFFYMFLLEKWIWSGIFFLYACLISPLSGLSISLILLKGKDKETLLRAFWIGFISLIVYLLIYFLIGSNLLELLNPPSEEPSGRGVVYRIIALVAFIIFNFNFFIFYLFKGFKYSLSAHNDKLKTLLLATAPQLLLIFAGSTFFIELGSFQLPLFWALAFPLGLYITDIKPGKVILTVSLFAMLVFSYTIWILPHSTVGASREEAGIWLKKNGYNNISVIGAFNVSVSILKGREGSNLDAINKYYFNKPCPDDNNLVNTHKDNLIIANEKKMPYRILLSKFKLPGLQINKYEPENTISNGIVKKIYENDNVVLYRWIKKDTNNFTINRM